MTENCGLLTVLGPEEHRRGRRAAALGRAAHARVGGRRSRTPPARVLPAGEAGEVCARGGNFMREYWNRPEETEAAFAGRLVPHGRRRAASTSDGYLYLVDRVKDMIVTGGENVYSAEVENAISPTRPWPRWR